MGQEKIFLQKFQAELDKLKKSEVNSTQSHAEFLWSMLANMCKVEEANRQGGRLVIIPFGSTHSLNRDLHYKNAEDMDYTIRVKNAIIKAVENLLFMYGIHLKELKKDINRSTSK